MLTVNNCCQFYGRRFELKISTPDCEFWSNIVQIPIIPEYCFDNDSDGYLSNELPTSQLYDPDDSNPCVPTVTSCTCDFDQDGIPNCEDDDDDNDGCADIYDIDKFNPNEPYYSCPCYPPLIIHTNSLCPTEPGACEQVCEHSTVTYSVENLEGNAVMWNVDGSEEFTPNGNNVAVDWGDAGNGKVKALVMPNKDGFNITCGNFLQNDGPGNYLNIYNFSVSPFYDGLSYSISNIGFNGTNLLNGSGSSGDNVPFDFQGTITIYYGDMILGTCDVNSTNINQPSIVFLTNEFLPSDSLCVLGELNGYILTTFPISNFQLVNELNENFQFNSNQYQSNPNHYEYSFNTELLPTGSFYKIIATDSTGYTQIYPFYAGCGIMPCFKKGSQCVSILPRPKSLFTSEPAATNGVLSLCKGESVQFTNTSEDAPQTEWDFGDGTVSVLDEPLHKFSTPGVYEVKLIAGNGCVCADTSKLIIHVSDAEIPDIECIGPICQGDSATYRTNVSCGNYNWVISPNGSIIGGGDTTVEFVTVQWNSGNSGSIQLTATNCTSNICDKPVREVVSILGGPVTIDGPSVVCPNSEATYTIPDFAGSDIVWSVSGFGNLISEGQNTNKISVKWGNNGGTVSVDYNNCFLECSGSGQKQVQVKPPSFIEGPIEVCVGDHPSYKHKSLISNGSVGANWQILDSNGIAVWASPNTPSSVSPTWNFAPGQYIIRAIPSANSGGSCSAEAGLPVTVFGPPPAPSISGTAQICPTNIYTYTAQSSLANPEFHWVIKNGSSTTTKEGSSVTVKWGTAPPYALTLTQTDKSGPGCGSAPATLEVLPLPALSISGPDYLCKESSANYTTQPFQDVDYQWSVEPATAGGILSGQGTTNVEVFWQTPGLAHLKLLACGVVSEFQVEITAPIAPQINYPDSLCPSQTAAIEVIGDYTSLVWENENGTTVSTSPTPNLGPGHYNLKTTDAAGCIASGSFFIAPLSLPEAKIKTQFLNLCYTNPITLNALESQDGYSFQWLHNNMTVGSDAPTFIATLPGNYQVLVTSQNGCTGLSESINLTECSTGGGGSGNPGPPPPPNPGGGQGCAANGEVIFSPQPLSTCDSVQFLNLSQNLLPNTQIWQVYDPLIDSFYQSTEFEPVFQFDEVGYYLVRLWGWVENANAPSGPGCLDSYSEYVRIPLVAKFSSIESCAGLPTRFTDLSTFLPGTSITGWSWDFGDPSSGAENSSTAQHPSHVFGQTGTYEVKLTIKSSTGCDVSFAMNVTVHGFPSISFDPPAAICAASALNFTANGSNGAISYDWDFGDPASGSGNFSQNTTTWHAYPEAGNYPVTVTATNIYGCTASFSAPISIQPNDLSGSISPDDPAPVCEGTAASFSAPSGGAYWSWSNGATSSSITTSTAGVYAVTVTDSEGCIYKPEPVVLEVTPAPVASIRAVELNDFGQPVAYHPISYTACEGEDVYLEMVGDDKYTYLWSDGSTGETVNFTESNGNLLPVGQHAYTVTVTDIVTGCTAVVGPFPVTINGAPVSVEITSNPPGPLCDGTEAVFAVVNPQAGLTYLWNSGDNGTSMSAAAAGSYLVQVTNQYGCTTKSDPIEIHNAAPVGNAPVGCYTRCSPTEICLPQMPQIAEYQWFLNGTTIPAPEGVVANFEATESGNYTVQMTSIYGCVSLSDVLSLNLETPVGDISGTVWFDANNNGVIDAADTPFPGIGVFLVQNANPIDTLTSNASGGFVFKEIPSENYQLQLDTAHLPNLMVPVIWSTSAHLEGCHASTGVQFLVKNLCFLPLSSSVQLTACQGDSASYNGTLIPAGGSKQFVLSSYLGCDSTVTVNVLPLSPSATILTLFGCPGDSVFYASQMIPVGQMQAFIFQNQNGCDSTVTVNVLPMSTSANSLSLVSCPGEPIIFDGQTLMPGDTMSFVYQNQNGCDSTIFVSVGLFQAPSPTLMEMAVCPGDSIVYNGETLRPGDVRNYIFQDQNGCDSLVNVTVTAHPQIGFSLFSEAVCPGTSDGSIEMDIAAGDQPVTASLDGGSFVQTAVFEGINSGLHTVQVQDAHGCLASQSIEIQELATLEIATEDYVLPCDEPFTTLRPTVLSHSGPLHWKWEDGTEMDWLQAEQAGIFKVKISDDCQTEERAISVAWGDNSPAEPFYVPNAFSPNNDGVNDVFRVYLAEGAHFDEFLLMVFDRWGNQLFVTEDPELGWNGIYRDQPMDPAVVVWYVSAKVTVCGRKIDVFRKGGVTIMR
ncbi:MAG: PKD domain-containing protein [Bacteroidetes bacterium]|nr:PKD domain-containing protein [Bacteroidota bacterium]